MGFSDFGSTVTDGQWTASGRGDSDVADPLFSSLEPNVRVRRALEEAGCKEV